MKEITKEIEKTKGKIVSGAKESKAAAKRSEKDGKKDSRSYVPNIELISPGQEARTACPVNVGNTVNAGPKIRTPTHDKKKA